MLILALVDHPDTKSYAVVPLVVCSGENRNLACGHAHQQRIGDGERPRSCRDAIELSAADVRVSARERALAVGWVGDAFASECLRLGAPDLGVPDDAERVPGQGRFWIGPPSDLRARRRWWAILTARQVVRMPVCDSGRLADLLRWADPDAPEAEAAMWHACATEQAHSFHLEWRSQAHPRRRTHGELRAEFECMIRRLQQD